MGHINLPHCKLIILVLLQPWKPRSIADLGHFFIVLSLGQTQALDVGKEGRFSFSSNFFFKDWDSFRFIEKLCAYFRGFSYLPYSVSLIVNLHMS